MAPGPFGTNFTESEALLAVGVEEIDAAREILDDMLPGERRRLIETCNQLSNLAASYCDQCGKRVDSFTDLVTIGIGINAPRVCRDDADALRREQKARRAVERERRELVLAAAERAEWYATLIEETGIEGQRLVGIRDGEIEPTDEELATLRAYVDAGRSS
jgi:hypothetical protein